jgi:membrane protease YdiL (CAAX protease family)
LQKDKLNKLTITKAFLITILLAVLGTGLAVVYAFLVLKGVKLPDFYDWYFDISLSLIVLVPVILILRSKYGQKWKPNFEKISIPVFSIFIILMLLLVFVKQPLVNPIETFKKAQNGIWFIYKINFNEIDPGVLIIMGFLIPVTEELFFRGIVLKQFLKNYSVRKSLIWSGIIFAVWHILVNPFALFSLFFMGLLLGYSFYKTRSILLPAILHVINNTLALIIVKEYVEIGSEEFNKWLIVFLVCTGLLILLIQFLRRIPDDKIAN